MYLKISKFLLSHEYLNMNKVPGFYQFFFSSDFEVMLLKSPGAPGRLLFWTCSHCCPSGILALLGTVGGMAARAVLEQEDHVVLLVEMLFTPRIKF